MFLTILLENIPQIFISTLYATQLAEFDSTFLAALLSSIASVILTSFSVFLEFPKHCYIYQIDISLDSLHNPRLRKSLRMRRKLASVICDAMDRDPGFFFVENIYFNGNDIVSFNFVSNEKIDENNENQKHNNLNNFKNNLNRNKKIMNALLNKKLRIKCDSLSFSYVSHKCVSLVGICIYDNINSSSSRNDIGSAVDMAVEMVKESNLSRNRSFNLDLDETECVSWTSSQVSVWIETKLRQGIEEIQNKDKRSNKKKGETDMEMNQEKIDVEIEAFMNRFNQEELNGACLKMMNSKENSIQ